MGRLGVYIHIPFCIRKCNYCDFCSFPDRDGSAMREYCDELCRRMRDFVEKKGRREVDTVYFGGGTPSLLPTECFERLFEALHECFSIDTDAEIEKRCGTTIRELIETKGEKYFRDLETEVVKDASSKGCRIISTGGGVILREENVRALKRNGRIFFIDARLSRLRATEDRPLSNTEDKLVKLYNERIDIYRATADVTVPDLETPEAEAEYILTKRMELIL